MPIYLKYLSDKLPLQLIADVLNVLQKSGSRVLLAAAIVVHCYALLCIVVHCYTLLCTVIHCCAASAWPKKICLQGMQPGLLLPLNIFQSKLAICPHHRVDQ